MIIFARTSLAIISFVIFPVGWALGAWQIFRKKNRIFGSILIGLGTLELVLIILLGSGGSSVETEMDVDLDVEVSVVDSTPVPTPTNTPVATTAPPAATATSVPDSSPSVAEIADEKSDFITDDQIELAKMIFKAFDDVVMDSEIIRIAGGQSYLLNVTVKDGMNQNSITEVGDAFVRMLKGSGPDLDPGKDVGEGKFSYVVAISNANETLLAQGLKCPNCTTINWSYFLSSNPKMFDDGTWIVGNDIVTGTYVAKNTGDFCYWERLSGFGGELDDIIANGTPTGHTIVTIKPNDAGFSSAGCGTWSLLDDTAPPFSEAYFNWNSDEWSQQLVDLFGERETIGEEVVLSSPDETQEQIGRYEENFARYQYDVEALNPKNLWYIGMELLGSDNLRGINTNYDRYLIVSHGASGDIQLGWSVNQWTINMKNLVAELFVSDVSFIAPDISMVREVFDAMSTDNDGYVREWICRQATDGQLGSDGHRAYTLCNHFIGEWIVANPDKSLYNEWLSNDFSYVQTWD